MIQKATELGVTKFLPIIFDRTIVRKINKERLKKIVVEASEQSNRINVPSIENVQSLNNFLKNTSVDLIFTDLNSNNYKVDKSKFNKDAEYKFSIPGIYAYWCTPHKNMGMIGFVVVGNDKSNLETIKSIKF